MNKSKLLDKLGHLLATAKDADQKQIKQLHKVLKKLRHSQRELREKLDTVEGEHERRKVQKEIEVIKLQRKKGVKVYKALKLSRDSSEGSED
jgi:predicted  nucleic acid-binding Zn-ribbon protein